MFMTTKITLGTNNGFAAKNWPEPHEWARMIAQDLGLRFVQFSFDLLDPVLPEPSRSLICKEVIKACDEFGLNLHSTFTGLIIYSQNHLAHPDPILRSQAFVWFQAALEVTTKLGARACGGHIGAMSATDYADPGRRAFIRESLVEYVRKLAGMAASLGQDYFIWELMPHPREIPHTPEEAIDLLEEVNDSTPVPVVLCFDLGHCNSFEFTQPGDPHRWLEKLLPWVKLVHLQQTDGQADHHWPFTPEYNRLGIINPERVVEIVKSSPFPEVPLFLELGHAFDASDEVIIHDHRCSVDLWMKYL
jgi:sugar phosphate isomerase/epimerase